MVIMVLGTGMAHTSEGNPGGTVEGVEERAGIFGIVVPTGFLHAIDPKRNLVVGERNQLAAVRLECSVLSLGGKWEKGEK